MDKWERKGRQIRKERNTNALKRKIKKTEGIYSGEKEVGNGIKKTHRGSNVRKWKPVRSRSRAWKERGEREAGAEERKCVRREWERGDCAWGERHNIEVLPEGIYI